MRRALTATAIALLLGLVALFAWQLDHRGDNAFRDALRSGKQPLAPAFDLPRLDHKGDISLRSLAGHAAVLNFWASWCPPCADEAPDLNTLALRYQAYGVRFVGVDFNDAVDEARDFAHRYDVPYDLVHDTKGVRQAYGVTAPPETYVLDGSGRAIVHIEGPVDTPLLEPYLRVAVARSGRPVPLDPDAKIGATTVSALHGAPVLVAFVAPSCSACTALLQQLAAAHGKTRVILLAEGGVVPGALTDPPNETGLGGGLAQRELGVTSFPTLLGVDARGRLVGELAGDTTTAQVGGLAQRAEGV